jgi:hypothetical protein
MHFGRRFLGRAARIPSPGAIGVFVDSGLTAGGFVDVPLPRETARRPLEDTEASSAFDGARAADRARLTVRSVGVKSPFGGRRFGVVTW